MDADARYGPISSRVSPRTVARTTIRWASASSGHVHASPQFGVADEHHREPVLRVHGVVGQQAQLLEPIGAEVMRLVDDEHGPEPIARRFLRKQFIETPVVRSELNEIGNDAVSKEGNLVALIIGDGLLVAAKA